MSARIRPSKKPRARKGQKLPPFDRLNTLFQFDPVTGRLTYSISGEVAGTPNSKGYLEVRVDGDRYFVHHIAYVLFHRRSFRHGFVTHKNRVVTDNRAQNLQFKKHRTASRRSDASSTSLSGEADNA